MAKQFLTDLDLNGSSRIINMPDAVQDNQPASFGQLKAAIEGLAHKDNVRVATQANVNLSSPGASIDGVALAANDRVLVRAQTAAAENGIYIWNGAAVAMTRALDGSTGVELVNAVVPVDEGTSAGVVFRQTAINITLGTTAIQFITFGTVATQATESAAGIAEIATQAETDAGTDDQRIVTPLKLRNWSGRKLNFSQLIGDGSATQYTVTHNLNTRNLNVTVRRNSGAFDEVIADVEFPTVNSVIIRFSSAPATNAFNVTING